MERRMATESINVQRYRPNAAQEPPTITAKRYWLSNEHGELIRRTYERIMQGGSFVSFDDLKAKYAK